MARLELSFLGPLRISLDGQPVAGLTLSRARALLAYLAVESDRAHPRQVLADLLWPDSDTQSALTNLRHALAQLRRALGDDSAQSPFLLISREAVQFNPASDHVLDVALLEQAVARWTAGTGGPGSGAKGEEQVGQQLASAVERYRGPFLEGFAVDSAPFEEWVTVQRERLHREVLAALQCLAAHCEQAGDTAAMQQYARRQVALEPTREEGQRQLMRALALAGERNAALAQYEACRRVLAEELDVEPAPETTALCEAIRGGRLGPRVGAISAFVPSSVGPIHELALRSPIASQLGREEPDQAPESPRPLFVAREEELAHLERWLARALQGQGRVGFVVGDPGSGKTMLLDEFARRAMAAHPELVVARGLCNAYTGSGDPYLPFREVLALLSGDVQEQRAVGAMSLDQARRLVALVPATVGALLERGPDLLNLLVSGEGLLARLPQDAPQRSRLEEILHKGPAPGGLAPAALLEQAAQVLLALARQRPLLLVLDDLQWADSGSINLLFHLARKLGGHRILVLGAYRPEEVALGREGGRHPLEPVLAELRRLWGENTLDLALAEGRKLVDALVDSEPNRLGPAFRETLHRHTGGHALFTAELLQSLREGGGLVQDGEGRWVEAANLDWGQLPARVEAVIEERIGRLGAEEQELLAVASVEGEDFHAEVLARVQGLEEGAVIRLLSGALSTRHRLVGATALENVGASRDAPLRRYRFRHYLFQHYLYERLDAAQRAHLHGQVGLALEALYGALPGTGSLAEVAAVIAIPTGVLGEWLWSPQRMVTSQLGRHFSAAGMTYRALVYLSYAIERYYWTESFEQALAYFNQILAIYATLPDSDEKLYLEFMGQRDIGVMYGLSRSYICPEVYQASMRAYELAQRLDQPSNLADALCLLGRYYLMRGELGAAREYYERAVDVIRGRNPAQVDEKKLRQYLTLLLGGSLTEVREMLKPLYIPLIESSPRPRAYQSMDEPNILGHVPWFLWALGYPDQALRVGQADLAMAHATEAAFYIAWVLHDGICFTHQLRREVALLEQALQEFVPLTQQLERPFMKAYATLFQGWVHVQHGELEQGVETLRWGLEQWGQNHLVLLPYWKGFLAEALAQAGRVDEGLAVLEEAREQAERGGEGWSLPEVYRLTGELLADKTRGLGDGETLGRGDVTAEAWFGKAIEVARGQGAKSWELRATTGLARLLREQGRGAEGRGMLAAIYGWFTEGFDTPDLVEARALLETLGRKRG